MHAHPYQHQRQTLRRLSRGFGLVEVLVSVVIFSFGLLGMVGLQAMSLQANREARLQSTASSLARELGELMRSNAAIARASTGNPYLADLSSPLTPATTSTCLNTATATAACANPSDIATSQMTEWLARVNRQLPGARVRICFDKSGYDAAGLPVWTCNGTAAADMLMIKIGWTRNAINRGVSGSAPILASTGAPGALLPVGIEPDL